MLCWRLVIPALMGFCVGAVAAEPISFVDDVLPVLSKAGCSGSSCHSKPQGQNGFQLSVFAYDPMADYEAIVHDRRGRRLSPGAPEQSLLLQKATLAVPHEGGKRFERGSAAYETILAWIKEGTPYRHEDDAPVRRIVMQPEELRGKEGDEVRFRVIAEDTKGRQREVTALAEFESNRDSLVEIDEHGAAKVLEGTGEAVIVARYMGEVVNARVTVPKAISKETVQDLAARPRANFIDAHAYARFEKLGLLPSEPCTDGEFVRRAMIDLIGAVPESEETRRFLTDSDPDKRAKLVARLLEDPRYADHWAVKWADLLRPNPDRAGVKSVYVLDQWLREVFRENRPLDDFARAVLTAQGSTHRHGPTVVYRDRRTPEDLTSLISQVFMGVRLECARCHHHPNEKWSQEDYFQMAAYFSRLKRKGKGVSPPISGGWEVFYHEPGKASLPHPVTKAALMAKAPDGPEAGELDGADPRGALANWLTSKGNPFFARAMVNRVWGELFGRGIVHPVDDFRATNPPTNPELLDALAEDFEQHGYNLKHLLMRITASNLYQQSGTPNASNVEDRENFARAYRRRLSAEVLGDALMTVTQVPDVFEGLPERARAAQVWNFKIASDTLDAFGRPDSSSDCPCERNLSTSVVQALHLMNAEGLQSKLSDAEGRVKRLAESDFSAEEIVRELYLLVYCRLPDSEELALATSYFQGPETSRQVATEDVLWALLNSAEFVFNH